MNRNESLQFNVITKSRPEIKSIDFRIKNIENIKFYDYEIKPIPISRVLNIWIVLIVLSIFTFFDALLVILKDKELGDIKDFIFNFPLNSKNKEDFIVGYEGVYKKYKLRIKPTSRFMSEIIRNLFKSFPYSTDREIDFIKFMSDFKTELYTNYRTRTAFIVVSPIVVIISGTAILLNYFYFEIGTIRSLISINQINKITLTVLLIIALTIIIFPKRIMTLLFLKKNAKIKF
jgi:hypothetical protein